MSHYLLEVNGGRQVHTAGAVLDRPDDAPANWLTEVAWPKLRRMARMVR